MNDAGNLSLFARAGEAVAAPTIWPSDMAATSRACTLCRLTVSVGDRPGSLAKLTTIISDQGANVIEVSHDRLSLTLNAKATVLVMMIELVDAASGEKLISMLAAAGFDANLGERALN